MRPELQELPEAERSEALLSSGLSAAGIDDVTTMLMALPSVHARVSFEMEGEEDIMEQDIAKCKVWYSKSGPPHALLTSTNYT